MDLTTILSTQTPPDQQTQNPPADQGGAPPPAAWYDSLPEAYRGDANIRSHSGLESLLAEYNVLKTNSGQSVVPDWNAPYDQHKDFFTKFGVPEAPDKYTVKPPEGYTNEVNQEFMGKMQQIAHKHKIPAGAFQEFAAEYMGMEMSYQQMQEAADAQQLADRSQELEKRWGGDVEVRSEWAKKAFGQFAESGLAQELEASGIIQQPAFLHLMSEIGKAMQAPVSPGAASSSGTGVQTNIVSTPQQAADAIRAIQSDPVKSAAYYNPRDPRHKEVNAEMDALYQKAYPVMLR